MKKQLFTAIRTQKQLLKRFDESLTLNYADRVTERMEYTRLMSYGTAKKAGVADEIENESEWSKEFPSDIDYSAKALLRKWEEKILTGSLSESKRFTQMYVAFKWMLGHQDSDSFPGAIGSYAGMLNHEAFDYIKRQLVTGEWDKLTAEAETRLASDYMKKRAQTI